MNSTRLTIITLFGLLAVCAAVGGIGGWILFAEVENSHRRLQVAGDRQYGQRIAQAIQSQLAVGLTPDQVLRSVQQTLATGPAETNRYLCLVTREGEVLCHPRESMLGVDLSTMELLPGLDQSVTVPYGDWSGMNGREAYLLDGDGRAVEMVQRFPVAGTEWEVLLHTNLEALRQEASQLNRTILAVMIPMGVLLVLLGTLMVRAIGRSFEKEIEKTNKDLERRVRERTKQHERTIQELERTRGALVLREKMALLGQLVAGIAHEINNPLWSIQLQANALRDNSTREEEKEAARRILQGTERCSLLVRNLLSFARQEPPRKSPQQLNALAETALSFCAAELRRAGIRLEKQLQQEEIPLHADHVQIEQVILNLLTNAIQALEEEEKERTRRRIRVETRREGDFAILIVEDNGPGVSEKIEPYLFEAFQTTKTDGEGTGLGLSLCRQFVRHHDGDILYERAPLGGARFMVRMPVAGSRPARREGTEEAEESPAYIG